MGVGEAYSLGAAATWALGVIAYTRLGESLSPRLLNLFKNTFVLGLLIPVTLALEGFLLPTLSLAEIGVCLFSGLIGIGFADTLYFRSLNALGAGHMGVVGNLYSPMMIVLSFIFLDERLSGLQIFGFLLVSLGVVVVSSAQNRGSTWQGSSHHVWVAIFAIFLMAVSIILVKRILEQHSVWWISTLRVAGGVAGLWLAGLHNHAGHAGNSAANGLKIMSARQWLLLVAAAFIGQFLSMVMWLNGYKYTSASIAAILNETASIFIVFFAWLLLGEKVSKRRLLGVALALLGVVLMFCHCGVLLSFAR